MDKRAVGIFDSGVGGLSCAGPFSELLPNESIIYFGDTLRAPYGVRPDEQVREFALRIADFLCGNNVKLLAIACNTITVAALDAIREAHPDITVLGTIEPASAVAAKAKGAVGVIATPLTIKSGAYERTIKSINPDAEVYSLACPGLVTDVEAGHIDDDVIKAELHGYLDSFIGPNNITSLVLGCTHFPLIDKAIRELYPGLETISSSGELAKAVQTELCKSDKLAPEYAASYTLFASSLTQGFRDMAKMCLKGKDYILKEHIL